MSTSVALGRAVHFTINIEFLIGLAYYSILSVGNWTFRPFVSSPPGRFAPKSFRPLDDSPPGRFAPWTFRPHIMDVSPP